MSVDSNLTFEVSGSKIKFRDIKFWPEDLQTSEPNYKKFIVQVIYYLYSHNYIEHPASGHILNRREMERSKIKFP